MSDPELDLDQVNGKVVTCEKVKIPTLQTAVVKGLSMIAGHQKLILVLMELSPKRTNIYLGKYI